MTTDAITYTYIDGGRCPACLQIHIAQPVECADNWRYVEDGLDPGIRRYVEVLRAGGVETYQSCDGAHDGASFPEPTIEFHGPSWAGYHAIGVALCHGLPVYALRREWKVQDGEPVGPSWSMTFWRGEGSGAETATPQLPHLAPQRPESG